MLRRSPVVLPVLLVLLCGLALPAAARDLKVATILPAGSSWMTALQRGGKEVSRRTEGRVALKFYPGGVMGNDRSVFRKIRIGQLQGGIFTSGGLAGVCPDLGLYSFPLQFRNAAEVGYVRSRRDAGLVEKLAAVGLTSYGFAEGGFAMLLSNRPIRTLADLQGEKIWVPEGDAIGYRTMETLGLAPVTLPITDVMTGLETGLVTIVASSPVGALAFQWYTRVKYITDVPISYIFGTLVFDSRALQRLQAGDRAVLREVMSRIYREFDRTAHADNRAAQDALQQQGLTLVEVDPAEVESWRRKTVGLARQLREEGFYSPQLYDRIQQDLTAVRSGAAGKSAQAR